MRHERGHVVTAGLLSSQFPVIRATSIPVIYDVLQRDLLHLKRLIINVRNFIPFPPFPEKHFLPVCDCQNHFQVKLQGSYANLQCSIQYQRRHRRAYICKKITKKAVPFLKKKKKKKNQVCRHSKPFSGHNFTIYFTASKPLKRSVIPTSWVLQEDTSDYRGNRFIFICESCDTFNHLFLSPIL